MFYSNKVGYIATSREMHESIQKDLERKRE